MNPFIIKIQKANSMKTCTCRYDKQLSLLRFFPHLAYFNCFKEKLPDFKGSVWKSINHHVCDIKMNFNNPIERVKYFHTLKVKA